MPLLRLTNVSIAFGTHALLKNANFQLDAGERVGLLGRNGEGKSTLMKIIAGNILADHGEMWRQPELKLAWLEQAPTCPRMPPSMMPSPAAWAIWVIGLPAIIRCR